MGRKINLNADMGESYGRYTLGDDEGMIPFVTTVNIASGFHAADPGTILKSVKLAKAHGVEVGAHISYPDFMGFGRRTMGLSEQEVFEICVYQIGAVMAFCSAEGITLNHVKPHGQLFLTGVRDQPTARGIVRAVRAVDRDLLLIMSGNIVASECATAGIELIHEGYVDLDYNSDGSLYLDRQRAARIPSVVSENAISLVDQQGRKALDGSWLSIPTESICLHGDMANATDLARAVRQTLSSAGHQVVSTRELVRHRAKRVSEENRHH
jgi:5-oxoprolinase (ATP-hydrolysing) subunit A